MKKSLLSILAVLFGMTTPMLAQEEYIPLVNEGVTWKGDMKIRHNNTSENQESYAYTIELKGDTVINDLTYKKCYYHFYNLKIYDNSTLRGFLREDIVKRQVFFLANKDYYPKNKFNDYENPSFKLNEEILLYDFADIKNPEQYWLANAGDECGNILTAGRSIELNDGVSRRFHSLVGGNIIEGIGFKGEIGHDLINVFSVNNDAMPLQSLPVIYSMYDANGNEIYNQLYESDYSPLAIEGNKWLCGKVNVTTQGTTHTPYCYIIKGDKEVNGKTYKCCYKLIGDDDVIDESKLYALLRDDIEEHRAYVLYPNAAEETILYDFYNPHNTEMLKNFGVEGTPTDEAKIEEYDLVWNSNYEQDLLLKLSAKEYNLYYIESIGFDGSQRCDLFNAPTPIIPGLEYSYIQFYKLIDAKGNVVYTSPATDPTIDNSNYVPLVNEGVRWECEIIRRTVPEDVEPTYHYPYDIVISGDSIINDVEYKKCHYLFKGYNDTPCDETMIALLREDVNAKRVYVVFSSKYEFPIPHVIPEYSYAQGENFTFDKEELLYDFADLRNSNQYWGHMTNFTSTDTIIDNVGRKMYVNNIEYNKPYGLIEGIGNMGHPDVTGDLLFPCPISNLIPSLPTHYTDPVFLNYYNENGELVYSSGRKASVESIGVDNDATEVARYDIYGRLLTNPTKGINIIKMSDGSTRKVFVK